MTSNNTSESVMTCCQYRWSHWKRLKKCFVSSVPMISYCTSDRVVTCCQYQWSHTTHLTELWRVVNTNGLILHVCKSCDVLSVAAISYDTEDEVRNYSKSLKFSILTAIVLDVSQCCIQSRSVHIADRSQTAVVVVNKGRVRSGQAVHRRLI